MSRLAVLPALLLFAVSCDSITGSKKKTIDLTVASPTVRIGGVALLVKPSGGLTDSSYSGTVAGATAHFGRTNDSTLIVIIPATVTPGSVALSVDLGSANGVASVTVEAGRVVDNPVAEVTTTLTAAVAPVRITRPSTYGSTWSADSAMVEREVAKARTAFAQLSAADQLEMARMMIDLKASVSTSAARNAGGPTLQDAACAQKLVGWEENIGVAEGAAGAAAANRFSPLKWIIAKAFALTTYIKGVLTVGEVGVLCTMEQNFDIDGTASADQLATEVTVTADRRKFIDTDAINNFMAKRAEVAWKRLSYVGTLVADLFRSSGDAVPSVPEPEGEVVATGVPVEAERVTITTTTVTADDGSTVTLSASVSSTGKVLVKAVSRLRRHITRKLGFTITRQDFATQQVEANVEIQPVCIENGQIFPGCVDRVAITPSSVLDVSIGNGMQLTAVAYDEFNRVLKRSFNWSSSDESSVFVTSESGVIQGLKVTTTPVKITARTGLGTDAREAVASVSVLPIDSTEIYKAAVLGRWTVSNAVSGGSSTYPLDIREGGVGAYLVPLNAEGACPTYSGKKVGGVCEYFMEWSITRSNGKYYLMDMYFWNGYGGEKRDPLTMPISGFTTYSNYTAGAKSRTFSR